MAATLTSSAVIQTTPHVVQKIVISSTDDADTLSVALQFPGVAPDMESNALVSTSGILATNLEWTYDIATDGEADFVTVNEDAGTQTCVWNVYLTWFAQADQDEGSLDDFQEV